MMFRCVYTNCESKARSSNGCHWEWGHGQHTGYRNDVSLHCRLGSHSNLRVFHSWGMRHPGDPTTSARYWKVCRGYGFIHHLGTSDMRAQIIPVCDNNDKAPVLQCLLEVAGGGPVLCYVL